MNKSYVLSVLALIIFVQATAAQEGHIKLLAVGDGGGNFTGSVADLYLTVQP
ncbi:hypothetical protein HZB03_04500, partial [Candidatus Woesearchaeota archaeon]|nr:hypothetical protein [Candidatus Woesearchaeota archaeon]